jgi:DNA-binding protein HU-beta
MNKQELVQEVAKKADLPQNFTEEILSSIIETITKAVSKGNKVTLVGFGTFEPRKRAARVGRNPQTGKELKIPAKTIPAFSAGKSFKDLVAGSKKK